MVGRPSVLRPADDGSTRRCGADALAPAETQLVAEDYGAGSDDTYLIASTALDVVEGGVQDADRRAWHRRGEDERSAVVDNIMPHDGGGKEDRCAKGQSQHAERGVPVDKDVSYAPPLAARAFPNV